ncbi:MAG: hypothetical protein JW751_22050 [Polyangiaceae bacterium]|nr:hypothetical protein [Polyangiaceae bacterium]
MLLDPPHLHELKLRGPPPRGGRGPAEVSDLAGRRGKEVRGCATGEHPDGAGLDPDRVAVLAVEFGPRSFLGATCTS